MSEEVVWQVPPSMHRWLQAMPTGRSVALLLRHSVRDNLTSGDVGYSMPINGVGVRLGRELGGVLAGRIRTIHSSPLARCMQTAKVLAEEADVDLPIILDRSLGDPGIYVVDGHLAWANWKTLGHAGVMGHLVSARHALPGMARPDIAARQLVLHMLTVAGNTPGIHVFVTHDSLVTATAAQMLGHPLSPDDWPRYLEGAFFWCEREGISIGCCEWCRQGIGEPLCSLEQSDVTELAMSDDSYPCTGVT